jgi:uncharacterized protein YjlB
MTQPRTLFLPPSDWVPNHPSLPVLVYSGVLDAGETDAASAFEQLFSKAGWGGLWRNGVFSYQHYHVGAHEVLGIAGGEAELLIGGPSGASLAVAKGDCLVLPAGTGHRRLSASEDFLVVGAYPPGQQADIQKDRATAAQLETIASLPLPGSDPLYGVEGPLVSIWGSARKAS